MASRGKIFPKVRFPIFQRYYRGINSINASRSYVVVHAKTYGYIEMLRGVHTRNILSTIATPARVGRALKVEHASSCSDVTRDATLFFICSTDCFLSRFAKLPPRRYYTHPKSGTQTPLLYIYIYFRNPVTYFSFLSDVILFTTPPPTRFANNWQLVGGERKKTVVDHRFKIIAREKNLETRFRSRPTIRLGKGYNNGGWPRKIFRSFRSLAGDLSIQRFIISTVSVDSQEIATKSRNPIRFDFTAKFCRGPRNGNVRRNRQASLLYIN